MFLQTGNVLENGAEISIMVEDGKSLVMLAIIYFFICRLSLKEA